jgi:hypothetical protein
VRSVFVLLSEVFRIGKRGSEVLEAAGQEGLVGVRGNVANELRVVGSDGYSVVAGF